MKSVNQALIRQEFTQQAAGFERSHMGFSGREYLAHTVARLAPAPTDTVLEVAAGTCVCGRALAPLVRHVTCLDMTPAMLTVGRTEAEKAGLDNMTFVLGDAAELPFLDSSFAVVLSRLAFHHFPDVERPFAEMVRVLRPGGKLVLIDMAAAEEPLRPAADAIERLRDPSHVRSLSRAELRALYAQHGLALTCCETEPIAVELQAWLALTHTPQPAQQEICRRLTAELNGGEKTGLYPYRRGTAIYFDQRWTLLIGTKG